MAGARQELVTLTEGVLHFVSMRASLSDKACDHTTTTVNRCEHATLKQVTRQILDIPKDTFSRTQKKEKLKEF